MRFDPKASSKCLPAGDYLGVLTGAEEKVSKSNNEMLVLSWDIYEDPIRDPRKMRDYITNKYPRNLKRLARAANKLAEYDKGDSSFVQTIIGQTFSVTLSIEDKGEYGDQNRIENYGPSGGAPVAAKPRAASTALDHTPVEASDIPF